MVEEHILDIIRRYLRALPEFGIHPQMAVLFGSFARGKPGKWSDIDLLIVAPEFDEKWKLPLWETLWHATKAADNRIEPIPCGVKEWQDGSDQPIIETARREGLEVVL
jgi:predicted nucleotidyltransferase